MWLRALCVREEGAGMEGAVSAGRGPGQGSRRLPVNSSSRIAGPAGSVLCHLWGWSSCHGGPCSPELLPAVGRVLGEAEPRQLSR